ncbi:MAG: hypothetical protein JO001_20665 [Alphaproteobacteria bacterium]|nr:hypothetical protein [Alphaproteobacteria bacterium]
MRAEIIDAAHPLEVEPSFKAPGDAIEFSKSLKNLRSSANVCTCQGAVIKSVSWTSVTLTLSFDNEKILQFKRNEQGAVEASLMETDDTTIRPSNQRQNGIALVRLANQEFVWKRDELATMIVGNKLVAIHPTLYWIFIHVENCDTVLVSTLIDRTTNRPFLFWSPP